MDSMDIEEGKKIVKNLKINKKEITKKKKKIFKTKKLKDKKIFKILKIEKVIIDIKKTKVEHTKYSSDNIMKKVKVRLMNYLVSSINSNLYTIEGCNNYKIRKLDNKFKTRCKNSHNLECIKSSIKALLSKNKENKKNIEILEKEKGNEKIKYMLNLEFGEWIDIFTKKKESKYKEIIFDGYNSLLKEISDKYKEEKSYYNTFSYYLDNYKRLLIK